MIKELILHETTAEAIRTLTVKPPHALLISGPAGCGKMVVATELISSILQIDDPEDYQYGIIIKPEDRRAIGINAVRRLESFLSLKVPKSTVYNRYVIFEDAHLLTEEAQNAMLKTLEEPPEATLILMTVHHQNSLLPTVRSRMQKMIIHRPSKDKLIKYFTRDGHKQADIEQAYAISGGLPGLMQSILRGIDHPLKQATERARQLISLPVYTRLSGMEDLVRDKQLAVDVIFILQQMAAAGLQKPSTAIVAKWQKIMQAAYHASEALQQNALPKLVLTKLMLDL